MPNERDGRRPNARASAISFPPHEEVAGERPSHADASHIARRRVSSAPAHEVDLDEVELIDPAPETLPSPEQPPTPMSTPPLALDIPRDLPHPRAPFQVPLSSLLPRRRSPVATVLAAAALVVVLALAAFALYGAPRARPAAPPASPAFAAPAPTTPTEEPAAPVVPVMKVSDLPRAQLGSVVGAKGHRLWVDGVLADGWQAEVSCGSHVVQVGSAGTPRTVDVACGQEITVLP